MHKTSEAGKAKLKLREGLRSKAYKCSAGAWTVGYGNTYNPFDNQKVLPTTTITEAEATLWFEKALAPYEKAINDWVTVSLTQNQFDALVSFTYNIGVAGFKRSNTLKELNKGNYEKAADYFYGWLIPADLRTRRDSEHEQFMTPDTTGPQPQAHPVLSLPRKIRKFINQNLTAKG